MREGLGEGLARQAGVIEATGFPVRLRSSIPCVAAVALESLGCLKHCFCGRKGGNSAGSYATLNVSYGVGDEREAVERNRNHLWRQLDLPGAPLIPRQVHGDTVVTVDRRNLRDLLSEPPEADAMITALSGVPLAVLTADCVSVVVCDVRNRALAVVHAGWRGTVLSVLWKTVLTMFETFGTRPEDCHAALGPSIAGPCYEVGEEVREAFVKGLPYGQDVLRPSGELRWLADLREANRRQLLDGRIPSANVSVCPYCTHCEEEWFFSARRDADAGQSGRQATVAMLV